MRDAIPFNRPFVAGKEMYYVAQAVTLGNLAGDGHFTKKCERLLEERFATPRALLTPSCTASLEMCAMLLDLKPGDEVIMPSYTFVSTASAFARVGAIPVFVDIRPDTMNIDETLIENAITPKTKAICVVHYAGVACEMDQIMQIANSYAIPVVEDAAQAVNSFYKDRPLGSIGSLGCYSFHETKNFICGEGGALCVNDPALISRAEIIRDKGTNRQQFFRGEVDKYTWVELGSSYVPSEICAAFLYAQLEEMERISIHRKMIHGRYFAKLDPIAKQGLITLPIIPPDCTTNYHLFYTLLPSTAIRDQILEALRRDGIRAVFHYVPLHSSPMGKRLCRPAHLPVTDDISGRLLRLPFFHDISTTEQIHVVDCLTEAIYNSLPISNAA